MSENKITMTRKQANFVMDMTEINDPQKALNKFVKIMSEEGLSLKDVIEVIEIIMGRMK